MHRLRLVQSSGMCVLSQSPRVESSGTRAAAGTAAAGSGLSPVSASGTPCESASGTPSPMQCGRARDVLCVLRLLYATPAVHQRMRASPVEEAVMRCVVLMWPGSADCMSLLAPLFRLTFGVLFRVLAVDGPPAALQAALDLPLLAAVGAVAPDVFESEILRTAALAGRADLVAQLLADGRFIHSSAADRSAAGVEGAAQGRAAAAAAADAESDDEEEDSDENEDSDDGDGHASDEGGGHASDEDEDSEDDDDSVDDEIDSDEDDDADGGGGDGGDGDADNNRSAAPPAAAQPGTPAPAWYAQALRNPTFAAHVFMSDTRAVRGIRVDLPPRVRPAAIDGPAIIAAIRAATWRRRPAALFGRFSSSAAEL